MTIKKSKTPSRLLLATGVLALVSVGAQAQEEEAGNDMAPPALFGFMVAQQVGLDQLGFSGEEKQQFLEGFQSGLAGGSMADVQDQLPALQQFLQQRSQEAQQKVAEENKAAAAAFLAELQEDPDVIEDPAGFYYEIIEAGDATKPVMEDEVVVHYKGTLVDGTVFDSSYDRGQPATFPMQGVIPGFSGGLSKIGQGGKVRIFIPAELGYGDNPPPQSPIPPGAMLIFDAEIKEVVPPAGNGGPEGAE